MINRFGLVLLALLLAGTGMGSVVISNTVPNKYENIAFLCFARRC